jgi:MFS family permease
MLIGACAYLLRCLLFAMVFWVDPTFTGKLILATAGQTLHGFCFGCFMAVGYMYVDRVASSDVRGSMQTLYGTFVLALGFFVGGFVSGIIGDMFTEVDTGDRDWTSIWMSCAALCAVCVGVFAWLFPPDARNRISNSEHRLSKDEG